MHFFELFQYGPVLAYKEFTAVTVRGKEVRAFSLESEGWEQASISFLHKDTSDMTFSEVQAIAQKMVEIMSM